MRMNTNRTTGRNLSAALLAAAAFAGWLGVGGCAVVEPWDRGTLADYTMRPDRDPPSDGLYEHVYFTREGASGGRGVGGGGCGCN
jgi:hypothetical protein